MSSIPTLQELNQSWQACVQNPQVRSETNPLSRLVLVMENDKPIIGLRPEIGAWGFFRDLFKRDNPEFSENIKRVKALFADVHGQDSAMISLQERINELGRYIYTLRHSCCIYATFFAERVRDFEVRHFTQTTLSSLAVVERGLPNQSGTLCWLNSALMYMAATTHYDKLLSKPVDDPKVEALRASLCRMITALRCNHNQLIINDLQKEVAEHVEKCFSENWLDVQQDASEFINIYLQNALAEKRPSEDRVHLTILYESNDEEVMRPGLEQEPSLPLLISPKDAGEIDIAKCLEAKNETDAIRSYYKRENGTFWPVSDKEGRCFIDQTVCTHLPNIIEVYIKRGCKIEGSQEFKVPEQKIKLPIELVEHELIYEKELIRGAKPKTRCRYKVLATIERSSSKSVNDGHYAANVLTDAGVMRYSGMSVTKANPDVFKDGYLLLLECEHRGPVEPKVTGAEQLASLMKQYQNEI